jgi:hypothetical protein
MSLLYVVQVRRMHVFSQCAGSMNISFGFGSGNPQIERDLDAAPDLDAADTLLRPLKIFYTISLYFEHFYT